MKAYIHRPRYVISELEGAEFFENLVNEYGNNRLSKKGIADRIKKEMGMFGKASEYMGQGSSDVYGRWILFAEEEQQISSYPEFGAAIRRVNISLTNNGPGLMRLFSYYPCGWKIPVEIDWTRKYSATEEAQFGNGGVMDVLGEYRYKYASASVETIDLIYRDLLSEEDMKRQRETISYTKNRKIVLYVNAIKEFAEGLDKRFYAISSLKNMMAYVLAHEIFHAFQDFHLNFAEYDKNHRPDDIEPYAEYFALRFVRDVLKDEGLYKMLVDSRNKEKSGPYRKALQQFGRIRNSEENPLDIREERYSEEVFAGMLDSMNIWGKNRASEILFDRNYRY